MLQVFYFVFACAKGPFCVRKWTFLLTKYFLLGTQHTPFTDDLDNFF